MPKRLFAWFFLLLFFIMPRTDAFSSTEMAGVREPELGLDARGNDALSMALKYVSYLKPGTVEPITSRGQAAEIIERINEIYAPCRLNFVLEEYVAARPDEAGLRHRLLSMKDLDPTRRHFDEPNRLVIINTGEWDRKGMGTPNAWTAMPGSSPSGTVIEGKVAAYPEMIAHELGHYLNLDHVKDSADLMNPVIYRTSTRLSQAQCESARKTAMTSRALALR
jgi:hypothetical protein